MPNQIRGSPGARVVGICLALDVVARLVAGAVQRSFTSDSIAREMLVGAGYGIVVAQLAMLAIWLGVVATSLYWMLVVLALLCSANWAVAISRQALAAGSCRTNRRQAWPWIALACNPSGCRQGEQ